MKITQSFLTPELKDHIYEAFGKHAIHSKGINGVTQESISFEIREAGKLIGCVVVHLFWGQLHIKYLLVEEHYRGRGIARRLMEHAFEFGINQGCCFAFLETMDFQAPEFYRKLGFKIDFVRHGYDRNTSLYYLSKFLFPYEGGSEKYEKIADWFDTVRARDLALEKPYLDKVAGKTKPTGKVLDLGCGMGEPVTKYFVDKGFQVTGIDGSFKMIEKAKRYVPGATFYVQDLRRLHLEEKFDAIILWHSFFHLTQNDQRTLFPCFAAHMNPGGILLFTSGYEEGEVWSDNGGENLYHASLSPIEYRELLKSHSFSLIMCEIEDKNCGGATVWIAKYENHA
jgi:SAM-dependent methyltransferase/GNAT superfamily N-acetyltransferase